MLFLPILQGGLGWQMFFVHNIVIDKLCV